MKTQSHRYNLPACRHNSAAEQTCELAIASVPRCGSQTASFDRWPPLCHSTIEVEEGPDMA
jgi:hypothetical protein